MKKLYIALAFFLFLSACDQKRDSSTKNTSNDQNQALIGNLPAKSAVEITSPSYRSQLLDKLPESTIAYLQIPSAWQMLGNPNPGMMQAAYGNKQFTARRNLLRADVAKIVDQNLPPQMKVLADLFATKLLGQIELAIIQEQGAPMPIAALSVQLEKLSYEKLNQVLLESISAHPNASIEQAVAAKTVGHLIVPPLHIFFRYDDASGILKAVSGMAVHEDQLSRLFDKPPAKPLKLEKTASYNGLMFWLSGKNLAPTLSKMLPPEQITPAQRLILSNIEEFAFTVGTSGQKARIELEVNLAQETLTKFLPEVSHKTTFTSVGYPRHAALFTLPTTKHFQTFEQYLLSSEDSKALENYMKFKKEVEEQSNITLEDWFGILGPELIWLRDEAGSLMAFKLNNENAFRKLVERAKSEPYFKFDQIDYKGRQIHFTQMMLPGIGLTDDAEQNRIQEKITQIFQGARKYWTIEDDYLLLADVPQILMDRVRSKERYPLADWVAKQQRQSFEKSLFFYSGQFEDLPAQSYYLQLQMSDFLAMAIDSDVNLFSLPTAHDLNLPKKGSIGFQIDRRERGVAMELSFENNILDVAVLGGSTQTVAIIGILAAVAIPAYHDYTLRAKVSEAFVSASDTKTQLTEFYYAKGRFPNQKELSMFEPLAPYSASVSEISISPDTGTIIIRLQGHVNFDDKALFLEPKISENSIDWQCSGTLENKYLPRSCRDE